MTESIYSFKPSLERENERVTAAPISDRNKEIIRQYHAHLFARGLTENRVVKLSWQLRNIAGILQKDLDMAEAKDIQQVMVVINTQHCTTPFKRDKKYSPATKADYGRTLRQFYKWLRNVKQPPPEVDWIKVRVSLKDKKLGIDLMDWSDIEAASQKATTPRDKALINFLYESGGRIGEILSMRIQDVVFKERYAKVRLDGKTGERWVPIVNSVPFLVAYLNTHPDRLNQNAMFWLCGANKTLNQPLKYAGAVMIIRRLYKAAGIKKRCNPHSFRHSRATDLCKRMTETQLRLYFGWEKGSDTPSVYTHLSGRDIDAVVLNLYGISHDEKEQNEVPLTCVICKTINNPKAHFCSQCGYALTVEKALDAEEQRKEEMDKTLNYMYEMMKNPELMKRFEEFKASR